MKSVHDETRDGEFPPPTGFRSSRPVDSLLLAVLIYYWAALYLRVLLPTTDESTWTYLLTVLPVSIAAVVGLLARLVSGAHWTVDRSSTSGLLLFVGVVTIVSLVRADAASIRAAGLMALTLLWLDSARPVIPVRTLNRFFVASIVAGGVWFVLGWSDYGLLPGQYVDGVDRGIQWRVSLFPFVPESGFLALIVFLVNQTRRKGLARLVFCAAALYFVIFSGMRSAIVALALSQIYLVLSRARRGPVFRMTQIFALLALFAVSILISSAVAVMPSLPGGAIGNFLFRTESLVDSEDALSQSIYRGWLWVQHLNLFASSPLTGIGTFDFSSVVREELVTGKEDSGSESFVTAWLARLGLCFAPFLAYLGTLARRAAAAPDAYRGSVFLVFGVAALSYGSFLVAYNFVFLILFCILLQGTPRVSAARVQRLYQT